MKIAKKLTDKLIKLLEHKKCPQISLRKKIPVNAKINFGT